MEKYILGIMLLLLVGCKVEADIGYSLVCDYNGNMYYQFSSRGNAYPFRNTKQTCLNQPDGSIMVLPVK